MDRSRFRTVLGIGLIVLGVIFLSHALAQPMTEPLHVLPALPALPPLPPLPALPPLPPLPPLPAPRDMTFRHDGGWFSPPLLLPLCVRHRRWCWRRR